MKTKVYLPVIINQISSTVKKAIVGLAALAALSHVDAQVTQLFPDGDFENPAGSNGAWLEVFGGSGVTYSYPATEGNPDGYGVIDATAAPAGTWAIWVGASGNPVPIAPLGLVAGNSYTFVMDMKSLVDGDGNHPPGIKIESWSDVKISDSGDMTVGISSDWATYTFDYLIDAAATGLKIVPLWSSGGTVGYDNIGVIATPQPLMVAITSPVESATVNTNFTIIASATVSPGSVTNVVFYDGTKVLGNVTNYPFSFNVTKATAGAHTLKVVAFDSDGNQATSELVHITVKGTVQPPLTYPTNNAPTPIWPGSIVVSVYNSSAIYTNITPVNWYPWGDARKVGDFVITNGNPVKSYLGLAYYGVELNPGYNLAKAIDISGMSTMHIDLWTTANQFAVKMVSATYNKAEAELIYDAASGLITSNHWVSLDIPLSDFTTKTPALNLAKIDQLLWIDNGDIVGPGVQRGDFYIDNVYFYKNSPIIKSTTLNGTTLTLKVTSQLDATYILRASPTIEPADWTNIQTNTGTGDLIDFSIPVAPGNAQRFFQIEQQ
jgi:hypothetical protein